MCMTHPTTQTHIHLGLFLTLTGREGQFKTDATGLPTASNL